LHRKKSNKKEKTKKYMNKKTKEDEKEGG